MRVSTSQFYRQSVTGMQEHQSALARSQRELASGRRMQVAADDPAAAERIVQTDHQLRRLEQYQRSLEQARASMVTQDDTLGSMVNVQHRVREIAINAENDTLTGGDRAILAAELEGIVGDLQALANAQDGEGNYLFAGFDTRQTPFAKGANGAVTYQGDDGRRYLQPGAGRSLLVNQSGRELFENIARGNGSFSVDSAVTNSGSGVVVDGGVADRSAFQPGGYELRFTAPDVFDVVEVASGTVVLAGQAFVEGAAIAFNGVQVSIKGQPAAGDLFVVESGTRASVFALVEKLRDSVASPASGTADRARLSQGIAGSLQDMDRVLDRLEQGRGSLGARMRTLDAQEDINDAAAVRGAELLSELRDLDYAEATTRLNQHVLNLQAAQQAFARLQGLSLFDLVGR
jgi:flagellar hook-associated protein 3 FlgL